MPVVRNRIGCGSVTAEHDALTAQLARTDRAIAESAEAIARLRAPLPRDPDPGMIACPDCGEPLEVDVMLHPHESGSLIGVARGFKPCACGHA